MLGIDIIEIKRFRGVAKDDFSSWNKVFTEKEWEYCFGKSLPAQHLAGVFASKEAVMKALGKSVIKGYDAIEIQHGPNGQPLVRLSVPTKHPVEISISHDKESAVAVVFAK